MNDKELKSSQEFWKPGQCETGSRIDQLNYTAYMGGEHKYMFDNENLVNILKLFTDRAELLALRLLRTNPAANSRQK